MYNSEADITSTFLHNGVNISISAFLKRFWNIIYFICMKTKPK